jgi:hypothetical protein
MLSALIRSRLGYPAVHLAVQPVDQRSVRHGPLVLVPEPRKSPTPAIDRDRTVSRRSEPSSRATLMGEQPNPWDLLQPQDVTSRHRGAKPLRRYELLGGISLLSPEYLLSFERRPFHTEPPDHYALVSHLIGMSASQSSTLMPLHSWDGYQSSRGYLWKPPLRFWRRPPQSNCPPNGVRPAGALGTRQPKGRISTATPQRLAPLFHCLRPILHIGGPVPALRYSKGSRGLFVPSRVIGIFTDTTISLGPRSRQCPDHYTIRAGRNLPDKEFRYLRTVIVTAAVYRGFNSNLHLAAELSS